LADETLDRVARRAAEGESIERPVSYIFGVARRVLLERKSSTLLLPLSEENAPAPPPAQDEKQLTNLDSCLNELPPESRALLLEYYSADASARIRVRQNMADRLGLSLNALRNRCLRLRQSLEECMRRQLEERKP
jgi:DNA-directed RNA polymerase specialized sigma24 family protein